MRPPLCSGIWYLRYELTSEFSSPRVRWSMRRRDFITSLGGAAAVAGWSRAGRTQQSRLPLIGYLDTRQLGGTRRPTDWISAALAAIALYGGADAIQ